MCVVTGCWSISLLVGNISFLSAPEFSFTVFCVTAWSRLLIPILWSCRFFLMKWNEGREKYGGEEEERIRICPKLISFLIGFASWRNWINHSIISNWFCCRSIALGALILFCVLLERVRILYKNLCDKIIFLWFLIVLLGVTNFIEIDCDRNQDGNRGCTY